MEERHTFDLTHNGHTDLNLTQSGTYYVESEAEALQFAIS
jgi:hypothetical protein